MNVNPVIGILLLGVFFSGCELFEKEEQLVARHERATAGAARVYFVATGATSQDVIQVRKVTSSGVEGVTASYARYGFLEQSALVGDPMLVLVLKGTSFAVHEKPDTIRRDIR